MVSMEKYVISSWNRIRSVMVSVLISSAVVCGYEPRSGKTKDYKIVFAVSLLYIYACTDKEKEHGLIGLESG